MGNDELARGKIAVNNLTKVNCTLVPVKFIVSVIDYIMVRLTGIVTVLVCLSLALCPGLY